MLRCRLDEISHVAELRAELTEPIAGLVNKVARIAEVYAQQGQIVRATAPFLNLIAEIADRRFHRVEARLQVFGSVYELFDGYLSGLNPSFLHRVEARLQVFGSVYELFDDRFIGLKACAVPAPIQQEILDRRLEPSRDTPLQSVKRRTQAQRLQAPPNPSATIFVVGRTTGDRQQCRSGSKNGIELLRKTA
jgi:hypothetical protein